VCVLVLYVLIYERGYFLKKKSIGLINLLMWQVDGYVIRDTYSLILSHLPFCGRIGILEIV
jgi:hypothetical protein